MPAKTVIVLEQLDASTYRYALWADVPAARQSFYADANKKSVWTGASAGDNTALAAGQVAEKVDTISVPAGSTLAQVQAFLVTLAARWQVTVNANNPWVRYGSFYDGAVWTMTGVA